MLGALGRVVFLLCGALLVASAPAGAQEDALAQARGLYNDGHYQAAIDAATAAHVAPSAKSQAALVLGRAHLELFRQSNDPAHLETGRTFLQGVDPAGLQPREQAELIVGLAEALFLEDRFGAAAALFSTVLNRPELLTESAHDRVVDWWATALDREAQAAPADARAPFYAEIERRMQEVVTIDPRSGPAVYWMVAAARGQGDPDEAWHRALAGWVRAPLTRDRGAALRADLDRVMNEAVIPDRARLLVRSRELLKEAESALQSEWELFKRRWTGGD